MDSPQRAASPANRTRLHAPMAIVALVALLLGVTAFATTSQTARAAAPEIISLTPSSGPTGTAVEIFGFDLQGATSVRFGTVEASFSQLDSQHLVAIAPANTSAVVNVFVTTPEGTSGVNSETDFRYVVLPVVTSISPTSGRPGTLVTVTGTGFTGATAVNFGGTVVVPSIINDTHLTVSAPTFPAGVVASVRVVTPQGTSISTAADRFTYLPGPTVTSVTPSIGGFGTQVTIDGTGFSGATVVMFGANTVPATVFNDTRVFATAPNGTPGTTVDVRVVTAQGQSPISASAKFTYATGPVITSLTPIAGGGGTIVTINGSGFTGASLVSFGGTLATPISVSDSAITVSAPARPPGLVNVVVTTPLGTSPVSAAAQFTYTGAPVVTSLTPATGNAGTLVVILGSGFLGATSVTFDGVSSTFTVVSNGQIQATAPANVSGAANVRVQTPAGISEVSAGSVFTYGVGPVITNLSPAAGKSGTIVTITGTGFTGATEVRFGTTDATTFTIVNSTEIRATVPVLANGATNVRVVTPAGMSPTSAATVFTYTALPVITSISPNHGTSGTTVTIDGTGFTGATSVSFGGTTATPAVVNDTRLVVTAPVRGAGAVQVVVTTAAGSSTGVATFTYDAVGGETITYTLNFRWSLLVWLGPHDSDIAAALKGELDNDPATNNVIANVTAIYRWNGSQQKWEANFPGAAGVPGANDFTAFDYGQAYWVASSPGPGAISWTVPVN